MGLGAGLLASVALAAAAPPGQGANVTAYTPQAFRAPAATRALEDLRGAGMRRVAVVATWYMPSADASAVAPDPRRTAADGAVSALIRRARRMGLSVLVKPQVDVDDGSFRGDIHPADPAAWWASYRAMVEHYATVAARAGADELAVGVELKSMSVDVPSFEGVIRAARDRFRGRLTYAANWDEVEGVGFWPALDDVGVDAYYPLATAPGASVARLREAWRPVVGRLRRLGERVDRPVVLTELGYAARPGAAVDPSGAGAAAGPVDPGAQARAYQAALEAWSGQPWMHGIYWWDWPADPRDARGDAYSPRGRPAAAAITRFAAAPGRSVLGAVFAMVPWPLALIVGVWAVVALGFHQWVRRSGRRRERPPVEAPVPVDIRRASAVSALPDPLRDAGPADLDRLSGLVAQVLGVERCAALVRAPDDPGTLVCAGQHGVELRGRRWPATAGVAALVLRDESPALVAEYADLAEPIAPGLPGPAAAAPLVMDGAVRGALAVGGVDPGRRLGTSDLELLEALADLVAAALERPGEAPWPDERTRGHLEGLAAAVDARAPGARRRGAAVTAMATLVGERLMGDDVRARAELALAARLHDVGRLREGADAPARWGSELLAGVPGLQAVALVVRLQEERWDGDGPHRIAGERIPLASRVVAACAAWASMIVARPGTEPLSPGEALAGLRREAGRRFDPAVVDAMGGAPETRVSPAPRSL